MNTVYFDMVGCRLNQAEIEALARDFTFKGYQVVDQAVKADLIVVNTCCVTLKAAADSRKMLRHYQTHTNARVISTGCWNSAFPEQADNLLESTNQFSNEQKNQLVNLVAVPNAPLTPINGIHLGPRQRTRAFIKVQDGCNNRCSYCLTQIARGPSRSEPLEKIIDSINSLVFSGIKEVVLTGVQIGSWGKDLGEMRIHNLIGAILKQTEVPRLRLSSIEPWDVTESLVERFENPRLCPHMHIPIQSGSDKVIRAMRRPISKSDLIGLLKMIRTHRANMAVTTDIIVGFPGETQSDLQETLDFIETIGFSGGHVFKFSPMPGTEACSLSDQVQESVRRERLQQVQSLFDRLSVTAMEKKVGSIQDVLFEASHKGTFEGYTLDYFRVKTSADINLTNSVRKVELAKVLPEGKLLGMLV
jgi:threonylcarbamoyladenosine tRNA methylthiotransferase MtaB